MCPLWASIHRPNATHGGGGWRVDHSLLKWLKGFYVLFFSFSDGSESAVRRQTAFSKSIAPRQMEKFSVGSFRQPSRNTHMSWKEFVILFLTKETSLSNEFMNDCC